MLQLKTEWSREMQARDADRLQHGVPSQIDHSLLALYPVFRAVTILSLHIYHRVYEALELDITTVVCRLASHRCFTFRLSPYWDKWSDCGRRNGWFKLHRGRHLVPPVSVTDIELPLQSPTAHGILVQTRGWYLERSTYGRPPCTCRPNSRR